MARNVEIKARVDDFTVVERHAKALATEAPFDLEQDDTFFACAGGRLKLRDFGDGRGELIHYRRPDDAGPKTSEYVIAPTTSPAALREVLARALGITGRIRKRRRVYILTHTRLHLDRVESLGCFVELEVVLRPGEDLAHGERVARQLMAILGIAETQLVRGAYLDLEKAPA